MSGATELEAKSVRVALAVPPAIMVTFVLSRVASNGNDEVERRTLPAKLPKLVTVMVRVVEDPTATVLEVGEADRVKSSTKGLISDVGGVEYALGPV